MAVACVTAFNAAAQSFSAATYNIRQLNAKDTAEGNGWERRLPVISSLIRFHDFDIFGRRRSSTASCRACSRRCPATITSASDATTGPQAANTPRSSTSAAASDCSIRAISGSLKTPRSPARAGTPNTSASAHGAGSMTDRAVSGSGSSRPTPTTAANRLRPRAAA